MSGVVLVVGEPIAGGYYTLVTICNTVLLSYDGGIHMYKETFLMLSNSAYGRSNFKKLHEVLARKGRMKGPTDDSGVW